MSAGNRAGTTDHGGAPGGAPRVAVFGSVNMDLVAYVDEVPASGETVTGTAFRQVPGGKGANQAVAAARAGADVAFLGAVGGDAFGDELRANLTAAGIAVSGLRTVPGVSGVAHIVVDGKGGNSIIVVPGANGEVTGVVDGDAALIEGSDALLLQLELPMEAVVSAARTGRGLGVPVYLTPAPARDLPAELLESVDVLVPNQHEAAAITGRTDPHEALAALLELVPEVLLTLGEDGSLHGRRGGEAVASPARRVTAVDTTAAGDTFCGSFAVARAEGRSPSQAMEFAAAAASLSVQRHGASSSMPSREEVEALLGGA
ncbi:ribokinase [Nocardiopsis sp. CT-R113]|uniref:Ribokinase n=1 Tax=Nocardiopsis codii TaxID=3065942 RepID=A0ABU7K2W6_9ACTN|nr:ribokinase [Nocardiopsis sp. CT-R113]MEE2036583.1 ribokinase [Nocardiopsis sp. CT-R113]